MDRDERGLGCVRAGVFSPLLSTNLVSERNAC